VIELVIDSIRVSLRHYQRVVILREKEADRFLPIWIGADVAEAIALRLQDVSVPRPQTHDLLHTMIEELGGSVRSVVVNDLTNDTFFARIHLEQDGRVTEVDSRPSDAIAIAVRAQVPIFVEESVLDRAGVVLDAEGQPIEGAEPGESRPAVSQEELERLSAFTDFVSELDLDDFDERSSG
jgi:bifunctional DNase/RNase